MNKIEKKIKENKKNHKQTKKHESNRTRQNCPKTKKKKNKKFELKDHRRATMVVLIRRYNRFLQTFYVTIDLNYHGIILTASSLIVKIANNIEELFWMRGHRLDIDFLAQCLNPMNIQNFPMRIHNALQRYFILFIHFTICS